MRTTEEIEARIAAVMQRYEKIMAARSAELEKPFASRNKNGFYFYFLEESIHKSVLGELIWYLDVADQYSN